MASGPDVPTYSIIRFVFFKYLRNSDNFKVFVEVHVTLPPFHSFPPSTSISIVPTIFVKVKMSGKKVNLLKKTQTTPNRLLFLLVYNMFNPLAAQPMYPILNVDSITCNYCNSKIIIFDVGKDPESYKFPEKETRQNRTGRMILCLAFLNIHTRIEFTEDEILREFFSKISKIHRCLNFFFL